MSTPRLFPRLILLAALAVGCKPAAHKMGVAALAPPIFQLVYSDPSTGAGLPGAVGTIVQLSGGTAAWQKRSASSTDWVSVPTSGGSGGGLVADGGVAAPLRCTGDAGTCGTPTNQLGLDPSMVDAWSNSTVTGIRALVPGLTRCEYIKIPPIAVGGAGVNVAIAGGGEGVASDAVYLKTFVQASVWPTPRTTLMGVGFRVKFPAIVTAKVSLVSICDAAAGGIIDFGWAGSTSATKWGLFPTNGSAVVSTFSADTATHTVILASDGTTITAQVDLVTVATSAQLSVVPNNPALPASFSNASLTPGAIVSRIVYCYADPS